MGQQIGSYTLLLPLGEGGMGQVWAARHRETGARVAVKFLLASEGGLQRNDQAIRNELRAAVHLDHPNIVRVYDYGRVRPGAEAVAPAGSPYLVMEEVGGGTLLSRCGRSNWTEIRQVTEGLLRALAHAHSRGVIHRDIKPANVLLTDGDRWPKLTDFGLAQALSNPDAPFNGGTPAYMAPEQFRGQWRDYGPWTDLYALGCTVYALVTGRPPFVGDLESKRKAHLEATVPPLSAPMALPAGFESWLRRLLEKDPSRRYRRAADALEELLYLNAPEIDLGMPIELGSVSPNQQETVPLHTLKSAVTVLNPAGTPEPGDTRWALSSPIARPPALPADWRALEPRLARQPPLGLGLFGLRVPPVVGREQERDRLWSALREVRSQGDIRVVAMSGGVGVGKSRLMQWLSERAHEVGTAFVLSTGHAAIPGPGQGIGAMVADALRCRGLDRMGVVARLEGLLQGSSEELAGETYALSELIHPAGQGERGVVRFSTSQERYFAVQMLLERLCEERPVVLALDDVHWGADALRFVRYLLENKVQLPLLVLLTAADEGLTERMDEAAIWADLIDRPEVRKLRVGPLGRTVRRALVEQLLGLSPLLADRIQDRTGGNPQFAMQLVAYLVDRGALAPGPEGFDLADPIPLPQDLAEVFRDRLERVLGPLPTAVGAGLELAAVLGPVVQPDEWKAACKRAGLVASGSTVEALLDLRLARTGADGQRLGWRFAHPLVRRALEDRAAAQGRLVAHHRVSAALLSEQGDAQDARHLERLGWHLVGAQRPMEALEPLRQAAEERLNAGDYPGTRSLLEAHQAALQRVSVRPSDPVHGRVALLRYQLLRREGQREAARRLLDEVDGWARRFGWDRIAAECLLHRGIHLRTTGDGRGSARHARQALALGTELRDLGIAARAKKLLGQVAIMEGKLESGTDYIQSAQKTFEAVGDTIGVADCWQELGLATKETGRYGEAAVLLRQAELLFEDAGNRWKRASSLNSQGDAARHQGEVAEAEQLYRRSAGLFRAIGSPDAVYPDYNLAMLHLERGEVEPALPVLEHAERLFRDNGFAGGQINVGLGMAAVAARLGDWRDYVTQLEQVERRLAETALFDEDIARTAELAAQAAIAGRRFGLARRAYRVALEQWNTLRREREHERVARRARELPNGE